MAIGTHKSLSKKLGRTFITSAADEYKRKFNEKIELGEKFREDKEKWEEEYELIANDDTLDQQEKIRQLHILKNEILETKENYEEVSEQMEQELNGLEENISEMIELEERHKENAEREALMAKSSDGKGTDAAQISKDAADEARRWINTNVSIQQEKIRKLQEQQRAIRISNLRNNI